MGIEGVNMNIRRPTSRALLFAFFLLLFSFLTACRQDMHDQPKYRPLRATDFFEDGRSARPQVEGTVARGHLKEDELLYTGKDAQSLVTAQPGQSVQTGQGFSNAFPFAVTKQIVDRGEERYNIYCSICHDKSGAGLGMVVRRGYRQPPSFHSDRLRQAPAGYFFDVITNGFGAMPDYSAQITARDRWAIVAYIRALQLAQQGTINDVPEEERGRLRQGQTKTEGQTQGHEK